MLLSVVVCVTGLISAYVLAKLLHLDVGLAAGLFSGGTTQSAAIGTASDAIMGLPLAEAEKKLLISHIAVADALCYVFGAIGVIWFCSYIGPWLLRIDLKTEAKALEAKLGIKEEKVGLFSATQKFSVRCYHLKPDSDAIGKRVSDIELRETGATAFVHRIGREGKIMEAFSDTRVRAGDILVLYGHTNTLVDMGSRLGTEVVDPKVTDFPIEFLKAVVTNRKLCEKTVDEIRALPELRCVTARSLVRGGEEVPVGLVTQLNPGDVIELVGPQEPVERAAKLLGYPLRPTSDTPLSIVGVGVFLGGLIGLPYFIVGSIKLTLTVSVGVLLAGLFAGWLRTVRPILPTVPEAAVQVMITLGLAVFVASTGMQAGPIFLNAVKELGLPLLLSGIVVTLAPLFVGLFFGRYVLRMHPVLLLGAVAGAQTYTGGMAAVQEKSQSRVAILGYTVPYATSNILLTFFGSVIVALMAI
jgi:putative transport protein